LSGLGHTLGHIGRGDERQSMVEYCGHTSPEMTSSGAWLRGAVLERLAKEGKRNGEEMRAD
jgi:hypothetical protein